MEKKRIFFSVLIAIAVFIYLKYQESELELGSFLLAQISKFIIHDVRPYDNKESLQFWRGGLDRVTSIFGKEADYNYSMVDIDPNVQVGIFYPNNNVQKSSKYPILLWFHGGGFVEGSVYADRKNCQRMSRLGGYIVVSVDYRLAPENKYPAAVNDSMVALNWIILNANNWGGDHNSIVIGGESAGGNLATATVIGAMSKIGDKFVKNDAIIGLLVIYPCLDHGIYTESHFKYRNINGLLSLTQMQWYWKLYLGNDQKACARDPRVCPLRTPNKILNQFPPTAIYLAGADVLFDEGVLFAKKLRSVGVKVHTMKYLSNIHGFFGRFIFGDGGPESLDDVIKVELTGSHRFTDGKFLNDFDGSRSKIKKSNRDQIFELLSFLFVFCTLFCVVF